MQRNSEREGGLATASLPKVCHFCHEGKAEIPISDEEGNEFEICESCDDKLFGFKQIDDVRDIILEALADYRCWWDGDDETDKEKREQVDRAIEVMNSLPYGT